MKQKTEWGAPFSCGHGVDRWLCLRNAANVYLTDACDARWVNVFGYGSSIELEASEYRKIIGDE